MNCPYCNEHIPGITGLQEAKNFQRHLESCTENPQNGMILNSQGRLVKGNHRPTLEEAVVIRLNAKLKK